MQTNRFRKIVLQNANNCLFFQQSKDSNVPHAPEVENTSVAEDPIDVEPNDAPMIN